MGTLLRKYQNLQPCPGRAPQPELPGSPGDSDWPPLRQRLPHHRLHLQRYSIIIIIIIIIIMIIIMTLLRRRGVEALHTVRVHDAAWGEAAGNHARAGDPQRQGQVTGVCVMCMA